jgi:hypothetical protein
MKSQKPEQHGSRNVELSVFSLHEISEAQTKACLTYLTWHSDQWLSYSFTLLVSSNVPPFELFFEEGFPVSTCNDFLSDINKMHAALFWSQAILKAISD